MLMPRDKAMGDLWTNARKRKVGADPDYDNFMRMFVPEAPTPNIPPPPPPGEEGPGLIERGYDYLFGGDDAGSPGAVSPRGGGGPATPRPKRRGPTTPGGRGGGGGLPRGNVSPAPAGGQQTPGPAIGNIPPWAKGSATAPDGRRIFWDGQQWLNQDGTPAG
jgi:hypothetical protein